MNFILGHDKNKCIFCDLPKIEGQNTDNLILKRFDKTYVLLNRFPYNNGHLMVTTFEHKGKLTDFDPEILHELMDTLKYSLVRMQKAFGPEGMNIGINQGKVAGAGYDEHMHFHLVPRWAGDTNYMPVIAETKVMADHLENTFNKLKDLFD